MYILEGDARKMTQEKPMTEPSESLQEVASSLADEAGEAPQVIEGEAEPLADFLASTEAKPVAMKTSEFEYPTGAEVPIPPVGGDPLGVFERIIDEADFLPASFLEQGAQVQRSVARVVLTKPHAGLPAGAGWATGFLISPSLFMTNNHVINDIAFASKIRIQFNYQLGPDGIELVSESFLPELDGVFWTNPALDYSVIRLQPNQAADGSGEVLPGDHWGFIPLNQSPIYREKQHFNVIQHPSGRRKEVALQDNEIHKLFENTVRYTADTEPGSSGSPVFDNLWQLVALHHAGGEKDASGKWLDNQGIRVDRIIADLRAHFAGNNDDVLAELGIPV